MFDYWKVHDEHFCNWERFHHQNEDTIFRVPASYSHKITWQNWHILPIGSINHHFLLTSISAINRSHTLKEMSVFSVDQKSDYSLFKNKHLVGGLNMNFLCPYIGNSNPNWLTHIFERVGQPPTRHWLYRDGGGCWRFIFLRQRSWCSH